MLSQAEAQPPTRGFVDLLEIPHAFQQQALLPDWQLRTESQKRGVSLPWDGFDALRRAGSLRPLYLYKPSARQISRPGQRRPHRLSAFDAYRVAGIGRPRNPVYIYSRYQLLLIDSFRSLGHAFRRRKVPSGDSRLYFRPTEWQRSRLGEQATWNDHLVLVLTATESIYRPIVVRVLSLRGAAQGLLSNEYSLNDYWHDLRDAFDPGEMLQWLGCDARWILTAAERLLMTADVADPLNGWIDLVRHVHPRMWPRLSGDALIAIERRAAAEMLLLFYEDLVRVEAVPNARTRHEGRGHGPLRGRLSGSVAGSKLDAVLTDFGLSPHPAVVLVVEGQTELSVIPKVFDLLGVESRREFIEIVNAESISTEMGLFASYVATPDIGEELGDGVLIGRPVTSFYVVMDPEEKYSTPEGVERLRRKWLSRIVRGLPRDYRSLVVREQLDELVVADTWGGASFEFAHFTDRELANAVVRAYRGSPAQSVDILAQRVGSIRRKKGNLASCWKGWARPYPSKVAIAEELWPALELRILDAGTDEKQLDEIPVVRVIRKTIDLALANPRARLLLVTAGSDNNSTGASVN